MKKKLLTITLSLVLALSLVACGGKEETPAESKSDKATESKTETSTEVATNDAATEETTIVEEEPVDETNTEATEIEETIEEPEPTTVAEITAYLKENGQPGDFMVSEDNQLITVDNNGKTTYPKNITYIDGEMFVVNKHSVYETYADILNFYAKNAKADPNTVEAFWSNKENTMHKDEPIIAYYRVEPTNNSEQIKITIRFPDGTIDWIQTSLSNEIYTYITEAASVAAAPQYTAVSIPAEIYVETYGSVFGVIPTNAFKNDQISIIANIDIFSIYSRTDEIVQNSPESLMAHINVLSEGGVNFIWEYLQEKIDACEKYPLYEIVE